MIGPSTAFNQFSFFHHLLGHAWIEEDMVDRVRAVFPKYQPTPREVEFTRQLCLMRAQYSLMGMTMGALTGTALAATLSLRNKSRLLKGLAFCFPLGSGYIGSMAWGELQSVDRWVTFERDAVLDSWNTTYTAHSSSIIRPFSFLAEGFRTDIIVSEAEALNVLRDRGINPSSDLVADLVKPLSLQAHELEMVYAIRYDHMLAEDLVDGSQLSEQQYRDAVNALNALADCDDDDPARTAF